MTDTTIGTDDQESMECALCGQTIDEDWGEHPPRPQCFGCAEFHTDAIENMGLDE